MKKAFMLVALMLPGLLVAAGKNVNYTVNGKDYQGFYVAPNSKIAPLVLLVHDWDGLTDYEKKRAKMLSDEGYSVFAMDLFGKGVRPAKVEDRKQHTGELYTDREKMRALMYGAMDAAKKQGGDLGNAVAMGYCFGGAAVLELARSGAELNGFVTVHGGLETPGGQSYKAAKGAYLIQHGAADQAVPLGQFYGLVKEMEAAGLNHEAIAYGGAPHAWTVFGGDNYRKQADERAWERQLAFFAEVLQR